jgi:SAM-dependent methyltransferase
MVGGELYLPSKDREEIYGREEVLSAFPDAFARVAVVDEVQLRDRYGIIVLDRFATAAGELEAWERRGTVVAIDEGGPARESIPYLIDVLPGPRSCGPNLSTLSLLDLPSAVDRPRVPVRRVLISFGGEDPAGLGRKCAGALLDAARALGVSLEVDVIEGALGKAKGERSFHALARVLPPVPRLADELGSYDLVVTHYGLTAFEAAASGTLVALACPTALHELLSREAGFPVVTGYARNSQRSLRKGFERLLSSPSRLRAPSAAISPSEEKTALETFEALTTASSGVCPSCGAIKRKSIARYGRKSYFRCAHCGMVYEIRFGTRPDYGPSYFFEQYQAQYGTTYLEDLPAIRALAEPRLDAVDAIRGGAKGRALDIGCAYGAFLDAAAARSWDAMGIDVSGEAVAYCREERGHRAEAMEFPSSLAGMGAFDLVTMWYVIEHFEDLRAALREVRDALAPGGIFAFSTPSGSGVSARKDPEAFFEASPDDHFTVWETSRVSSILRRHGFELLRIRVTGHHPERFPFARGGIGRAAWGIASRVFGLGDTFEAYARKTE